MVIASLARRHSSKAIPSRSDFDRSGAHPSLLYPRIHRHLNYQTRELGFGHQNIRSVGSKVDSGVARILGRGWDFGRDQRQLLEKFDKQKTLSSPPLKHRYIFCPTGVLTPKIA